MKNVLLTLFIAICLFLVLNKNQKKIKRVKLGPLYELNFEEAQVDRLVATKNTSQQKIAQIKVNENDLSKNEENSLDVNPTNLNLDIRAMDWNLIEEELFEDHRSFSIKMTDGWKLFFTEKTNPSLVQLGFKDGDKIELIKNIDSLNNQQKIFYQKIVALLEDIER